MRAKQPQGSETILVVDDDKTIRLLIRLSLQSYGYSVLEAKEGNEALKICQEHAGPIHLLLTDVVMPGMNGLELLNPATPFFHKPFSLEDLARTVREVLDSAA